MKTERLNGIQLSAAAKDNDGWFSNVVHSIFGGAEPTTTPEPTPTNTPTPEPTEEPTPIPTNTVAVPLPVEEKVNPEAKTNIEDDAPVIIPDDDDPEETITAPTATQKPVRLDGKDEKEHEDAVLSPEADVSTPVVLQVTIEADLEVGDEFEVEIVEGGKPEVTVTAELPHTGGADEWNLPMIGMALSALILVVISTRLLRRRL